MWHYRYAILIQATQFCNSDHNDPIAPNKNNYWCRNRSVKSVIDNHSDFMRLNSLAENTSTEPTFRYLSPTPQPVYIVVDTSTHGDPSLESCFEEAKLKINQLLGNIATARGNALVRILTMGGTAFNSSSGLGGYLNSVTEPLEVKKKTYKNGISIYVNMTFLRFERI